MGLSANLKNSTSLSGVFGGHAEPRLADHAAGYTLDGGVKLDESSVRIAGFGLTEDDTLDGEDQSRQRRAGLEQAADVEERANNQSGRRRGRANALGKIQCLYYNISDKDGYYYVWGHERANPNNEFGPRKMSNAQLRKLLIKLIVEDGCNEIYFYRNNAIDMDAVSRARTMIMMELRQSLAAAGIDTSKTPIIVSPTLMKDPEPWAGPLRQLFGHSASVRWQDFKYNNMMRGRDRRESRLLAGTTIDHSEPAPAPN